MNPISKTGLCAASLLLALTAPHVIAENTGDPLPPETASLHFKSGTNVALAQATCLECHSADYITSQPPQTRASWLATIQKMIDRFGMIPLSPEDETRVLDYLETNYGP